VVVPAELVDGRFFELRTRVAGDFWFLADRAELDERLRTSAETLGRSR
jgi:hypothetical protein